MNSGATGRAMIAATGWKRNSAHAAAVASIAMVSSGCMNTCPTPRFGHTVATWTSNGKVDTVVVRWDRVRGDPIPDEYYSRGKVNFIGASVRHEARSSLPDHANEEFAPLFEITDAGMTGPREFTLHLPTASPMRAGTLDVRLSFDDTMYFVKCEHSGVVLGYTVDLSVSHLEGKALDEDGRLIVATAGFGRATVGGGYCSMSSSRAPQTSLSWVVLTGAAAIMWAGRRRARCRNARRGS